MSKIYDYNPVMLFPWYIQEWEHYDMSDYPIASGEYYSRDVDGETPLRFSKILEPLIPDESQRKRVVNAIEDYLYEESLGITNDESAKMFFNGEL